MLDDLADVHNHFLKLEKRYYRIYGEYAGRYRLQPHLTKLLKRTKQHWAWIPRDTLDAVIIRLHDAYQRAFSHAAVGFPKFKRKGRYRSAKFQTGYKLENGRVRLSFKAWNENTQCLKFDKRWFSFHQHRDWHGKVKYIQILREATGTYWIYVVTDDTTQEVLPTTGESVGADMGIETFVAFSNGEKLQHPQPLKQSLKHLRTLNKALSRKVKGSGNFWRAIRNLARLHRKIAQQRLDWHWKLATDLCRRFDTIAIEPFKVSKIPNFRQTNRKAYDLAPYQFVEVLKFKCFKHQKTFHESEVKHTSETCSDCGHIHDKLSLNLRQWTCPSCGSDHDRDVNAAINILRGCLDPLVEQM